VSWEGANAGSQDKAKGGGGPSGMALEGVSVLTLPLRQKPCANERIDANVLHSCRRRSR